MVFKPRKVFKPLPVVDLNYETTGVNYYPATWAAPSHNSNVNWKQFITVRNRVRVNRISSKTTRGDLHEIFSTFGIITSISPIMVVRNRFGDFHNEGHAFVTFYFEEDAQAALKCLQIFLNGKAVYVHRAVQTLDNITYEIEPLHRIYSMETMYAINDLYNRLFLEQNDGSNKKLYYAWIVQSIDTNIPHNLKRTTIIEPTSDDDESYSTSSASWDFESESDIEFNPWLESEVSEESSFSSTYFEWESSTYGSRSETESQSFNSESSSEIILESASSSATIDSDLEFNLANMLASDDQEVEDFVGLDSLHFNDDQGSDDVNYKYENDINNYSVYYDDQQTIYYLIGQNNETEEGYDTNNQYSIPEQYYDYDTLNVDRSMYPEAPGPIINLNACDSESYQFCEYRPVVTATFHEYPINDQFGVSHQIVDLPLIVPPIDTYGISDVPHHSRQLPKLLPEVPQLLEPDKLIPPQSLQYNPNETVEYRDTSLTFCESDNCLKILYRDIQGCSTSQQFNLLEISETLIKPNTSLNKDAEKVPDKTQYNNDIIVESPQDATTQFPEHDENLINIFATEVDESNNEDGETSQVYLKTNTTKCGKRHN